MKQTLPLWGLLSLLISRSRFVLRFLTVSPLSICFYRAPLRWRPAPRPSTRSKRVRMTSCCPDLPFDPRSSSHSIIIVLMPREVSLAGLLLTAVARVGVQCRLRLAGNAAGPANKQHILYSRQGEWFYSQRGLTVCLFGGILVCFCTIVLVCAWTYNVSSAARSDGARLCPACSNRAEGSGVITGQHSAALHCLCTPWQWWRTRREPQPTEARKWSTNRYAIKIINRCYC